MDVAHNIFTKLSKSKQYVWSNYLSIVLSEMINWLIDWLIDWIVFYAISAIFQPYNGGVWNKSNILFVIVYEDA